MRRIAIAFAATVSVLVLVFSYRTSTGTVTAGVPGLVRPPATSAAPTSPGAGSSGGTFDGQAADTPYGPVQVEITVSGGRITDARVLQVPQESGRDVRINSAA